MTNETPVPLPPLADTRQQLIAAIREHTRRALAQVGLRLTRNLAARFSADNPPRATGLAEPTRDALLPALAFAEQFAEQFAAAPGRRPQPRNPPGGNRLPHPPSLPRPAPRSRSAIAP